MGIQSLQKLGFPAGWTTFCAILDKDRTIHSVGRCVFGRILFNSGVSEVQMKQPFQRGQVRENIIEQEAVFHFLGWSSPF